MPTAAATLVRGARLASRPTPGAPDHPAHRGDAEGGSITGTCARVAGAVTAGLQGLGLQPRQTVAIMLPTSREYFFATAGVLLAGGIPVPIYPPARPAQIERHVRRHIGILANAGAGILVTVPEAMPMARLLEAGVPACAGWSPWPASADSPPTPVALRADDIAFIQYTSGAPATPRAWC